MQSFHRVNGILNLNTLFSMSHMLQLLERMLLICKNFLMSVYLRVRHVKVEFVLLERNYFHNALMKLYVKLQSIAQKGVLDQEYIFFLGLLLMRVRDELKMTIAAY
jgi:hypothetical protein